MRLSETLTFSCRRGKSITVPFDKPTDNVIEARYLLLKKRFENEYKWTPTPEIEAVIVNTVFESA